MVVFNLLIEYFRYFLREKYQSNKGYFESTLKKYTDLKAFSLIFSELH